jgi:carbamoyl-phosphate synthase large subunit
VVKLPRFSFEKFPNTPQLLSFSMQSVGESMAIGRTFNEALQKGLRSLEIGVAGLETRGHFASQAREKLPELLRIPTPDRIFAVGDAFRAGMTVEEIYALSNIDPWFLREIRKIVELEKHVILSREDGEGPRDSSASRATGRGSFAVSAAQDDSSFLRTLKRNGFSDRQIARLTDRTEDEVRRERHARGIRPVYKRVDTCATAF